MKITPRDIARALIASIEATPALADQICDGAIALLKKYCPSVTLRDFVKIADKELRRHGVISSGMLVVPHERAISADVVAKQFSAVSGHSINIERKIDPSLIGGAVFLVDHRRIDSSVQGALQTLLKQCLLPLD